MKPSALLFTVLCSLSLALSAVAQQVPAPTTSDEVTPPATGVVMPEPYARVIAGTAYVWGWPLRNTRDAPQLAAPSATVELK